MNLSIMFGGWLDNDAVNIMNLITRLLLNNRLRNYVPSSTRMLEPNISAFKRFEVWTPNFEVVLV